MKRVNLCAGCINNPFRGAETYGEISCTCANMELHPIFVVINAKKGANRNELCPHRIRDARRSVTQNKTAVS